MRRELIAPETLRSIRLRQVFGGLIGNTDMHFGNLAFWFDDALPFRLAPAYDMLSDAVGTRGGRGVAGARSERASSSSGARSRLV